MGDYYPPYKGLTWGKSQLVIAKSVNAFSIKVRLQERLMISYMHNETNAAVLPCVSFVLTEASLRNLSNSTFTRGLSH